MSTESEYATGGRWAREKMQREFDTWVGEQDHAPVGPSQLDELRVRLFGHPDDLNEAAQYAQTAYDAVMAIDGLGMEEAGINADVQQAIDVLMDVATSIRKARERRGLVR